jgi:hypothetical protein
MVALGPAEERQYFGEDAGHEQATVVPPTAGGAARAHHLCGPLVAVGHRRNPPADSPHPEVGDDAVQDQQSGYR